MGKIVQLASSEWCESDSEVKCVWEVICRMDTWRKGNGDLVEVVGDISGKAGYGRNGGNRFWRGVEAICGIKRGVRNHEGKTRSGGKTSFRTPSPPPPTLLKRIITGGGV